jgi:CubicO group peptidase (beta-lactamase class C family)
LSDVEPVVEVIEGQLARGVVGVSAAVVLGAEIVWSAGFGVTDLSKPAPMTPTSTCCIQSVSKSLVATALMHFAEVGTLRLDDPVNAHLGDVQIANRWEDEDPVTIRQLLTHTAGLPESFGWSSSTSLEEDVAQYVATEARPGSRLVYANGGYDALGLVLARLAGRGWDRVVAEAVLAPLGMAATGVVTDKDDRRAVGHVFSHVNGATAVLPPAPSPYEPPPPSGSMVSTAEDLARFLIAHLNGGGAVLSPETVQGMHRLHVPAGPGGGGMGLGFRVDQRGGRPFFCHGGDGNGFTTFIGGHPEERVGIVVLINTGGAHEARSAIVRAGLAAVLEETPARRDPSALPVQFAGGYRSTYWDFRAELSQGRDGEQLAVLGPMLSSESTGHLTPLDDRWRGEGGIFDGWELDFADGPDKTYHFYGGVYPFDFVADDTPIIRVPTRVDESGNLTGAWAGTMDTPVGPVPFELQVDPPSALTVTTMGATNLAMSDVTANAGWVTGRFELHLPDIGGLAVFVRLGLVHGQLDGMAYVTMIFGEYAIPLRLERH